MMPAAGWSDSTWFNEDGTVATLDQVEGPSLSTSEGVTSSGYV